MLNNAFTQTTNTNTSSPKSRGGKEVGGKKDKKKNQQAKDKKTVSLQDFQAEGSAGERNVLIRLVIELSSFVRQSAGQQAPKIIFMSMCFVSLQNI